MLEDMMTFQKVVVMKHSAYSPEAPYQPILGFQTYEHIYTGRVQKCAT